jgi:hypothetical protein
MEIPIVIRHNHYRDETVEMWKSVWSTICEMCYNGNFVTEKIIVEPTSIQIDEELILNASRSDHYQVYKTTDCENLEELTLDYTWRQYSKKAGPRNLLVIPEFRRLHVPECLFESHVVKQWFRH